MADKVYAAILNSLQRQLDRNWTLMWDPKTVAEEIKASLYEFTPAEIRAAVQQPPPMFNQYGQPGLIGEVSSATDVRAEILHRLGVLEQALSDLKDVAFDPKYKPDWASATGHAGRIESSTTGLKALVSELGDAEK